MSYSRLKQNFNEPRGHSSAVASVLYTRGADNSYAITKSGSYVYFGDAANYHEWEFRTRLRVKASGQEEERYAEAMSKVVDGLRGDAFIIAKEVGLDKIWDPGSALIGIEPGVDVLITAIKLSVFPLTTYEAKELFRQYCKPSGSLSRQNGESMHQYISRRRRCWKLLKELDPEIVLSEGHRADMLLDLAGLDKNERTMIQASIGNARDFEKIADALVVQHPRVHLKPSTSLSKGGGKGGGKSGKGKGKSGKGKFRKGKGPWRNPAGFAGVAVAESWDDEDIAYLAGQDEEEPYADPAHWHEEEYDAYYADEEPYYPEETTEGDWTEYSAYVADEWSKKWETTDQLESSELECIACLCDTLGPDCFEDPECCSNFIQNGTTAFLAKGGKKGGGKKGGGKYPVRPSNLTIEDRRKKLQELKSKTECKDCGRRGHWKGDRECTMTKQKSAYFAVKSHGHNVFDHSDSEGDEPGQASACMAVRTPKPITPKLSKISEAVAMEWTFPDGQVPPEGCDRKFTTGSLKNKTYLDVTLEHPEHYFSHRKSKTLDGNYLASIEAREYLAWVETYFQIDSDTKQLTPKL